MKNLIVYYSYAGNTKKVAEEIAKKVNGTLCPLTLKEDYTKDYDALVNEMESSNNENNQPELKDLNVSLDEFDRVFVLTPVWWYTLSCPVNTFLHQNNLEGKEVILVSTNAGWLGETFENMKKLVKEKVLGTINCLFNNDVWQNKDEVDSKLQALHLI